MIGSVNLEYFGYFESPGGENLLMRLLKALIAPEGARREYYALFDLKSLCLA